MDRLTTSDLSSYFCAYVGYSTGQSGNCQSLHECHGGHWRHHLLDLRAGLQLLNQQLWQLECRSLPQRCLRGHKRGQNQSIFCLRLIVSYAYLLLLDRHSLLLLKAQLKEKLLIMEAGDQSALIARLPLNIFINLFGYTFSSRMRYKWNYRS